MVEFYEIQTQTAWGKVLQDFAAWCRPQAGWKVLDVGCGPGLLPALFQRQGCKAVGADLEAAAYRVERVHPELVCADALNLPFLEQSFDLVTASNLLFLLPDPLAVLGEMRRVARVQGQVICLNPSERLSVTAASELVSQRGLQGLARQSLLNWAARAESGCRWSEAEMGQLYAAAGLELCEMALKMGPGFARFSRAVRER